MANQTISQLPAAGPITGTELVPIVQNGGTYHTTAAALAGSPVQTQTFLTQVNEPTLNNSRYLSTDGNLSLTDGGAQSFLRINLTGAAASLNSAGNGFQVKTGLTTVVPRTITVSTAGISISNGDGVSANPAISLTGQVLSLANASGPGLVALPNNGSVVPRSIQGTANEIDVADGSGAAGNPTIGLADNPVLPGTAGAVLPSGTNGQRPGLPTAGTVRYNTTSQRLEGYTTGWQNLGTGDGTVTSVDASGGTTGLSFTGGPITTSGVLTLTGTPTKATNVAGGAANKVVYQTALDTTSFIDAPVSSDTFLKWTGSGFTWAALPGAGTVTSVGLALPSEFTITGSPVTSSGTLTGSWASQSANYFLAAPNGAPGTPAFRAIVAADVPTLNQNTTGNAATATTATNIAGGAAGSIPYQTSPGTTAMLAAGSGVLVGGSTPSYSTAPTLTGTNFSGIPNAALSNNSITIGSTSVSLGATATSLAGLTSVSVTQAPTAALQLATKQYVDDAVSSGITIHAPVRVETPVALNATYAPGGTAVTVTDIVGGTTLTFSTSPSLSVNDQIVFSSTSNGIVAGTAYYVYSVPAANQVALSLSYSGPEITTLTNGSGLSISGTVNAGVGATLTNAGTKAALQIDGVTLSVSNRVLVYNQTNAYENGVYTVTTVGTPDPGGTNWVLTRATAENTYKPDSTSGLGQGDYFFVQEGATGAGESYVLTTNNPLIIGTTNLTFTQFAASQVYSAGTGLTLSGTQFSLTIPVTTPNGGTGLTTYTTGDLLYYATGTALSKLAISTSSYLLTSSGSAPQWSDPAGVTVGSATSATSATTATNVAGGAANKIVYNTAAGVTNFIDAPVTTGHYLKWNGSAFVWDVAGTGTVTSIDVSGGTTGLTTSGGPVTTSGTITLGGTLAATHGGTGITGYGVGDLVYANTTTSLDRLPIGVSSRILTSNGTAPVWTDPSGITVGSATNATNATNVAVTSTGTNADFYIPFVASSSTGNQALGVDAGLSYNPSTNAITSGISGGTF